LIDYGIEPQQIQIAGMPIHLDFQPVSPEKKAQLRLKYGLKPDKFTLLINAGWVGGGNVPKIYQTLLDARDLDIQVVFLAGRNYALKEQALKLARNSKIPIAIIGFLPNIRDLMNLADVMVSKLGGLTTFEAIACELPIIADTLTEPMPQEACTVKWLKRLDMGIFLDRPEQIVEAIASFLESPERLQAIKCAYRTHARPDAARSIARQILNLGDRAVI
jgi:UDP-N-acetylglucosamine:LPS N-acetylglucosamine transferase